MILLHFFGLGDVLRRFELEQITGLTIMGFRPLSLDELMLWAQNMADQHHWDGEAIHHDVMSTWLDQAEDITRWRHRLKNAGRSLALSSHECQPLDVDPIDIFPKAKSIKPNNFNRERLINSSKSDRFNDPSSLLWPWRRSASL